MMVLSANSGFSLTLNMIISSWVGDPKDDTWTASRIIVLLDYLHVAFGERLDRGHLVRRLSGKAPRRCRPFNSRSTGRKNAEHMLAAYNYNLKKNALSLPSEAEMAQKFKSR